MMAASSSIAQLADIALVWSNATGDAGIAILDQDIASDRGLETAVLLSLFLDRRAEPDDAPPSGDPLDRRGWWADSLADVEGDRIGSRLWLLARAKRTRDTLLRAKEYVLEALAWMREDRVADRIEVSTEFDASGALLIAVDIRRPTGETLSLRYAHAWDSLQEVR